MCGKSQQWPTPLPSFFFLLLSEKEGEHQMLQRAPFPPILCSQSISCSSFTGLAFYILIIFSCFLAVPLSVTCLIVCGALHQISWEKAVKEVCVCARVPVMGYCVTQCDSEKVWVVCVCVCITSAPAPCILHTEERVW